MLQQQLQVVRLRRLQLVARCCLLGPMVLPSTGGGGSKMAVQMGAKTVSSYSPLASCGAPCPWHEPSLCLWASTKFCWRLWVAVNSQQAADRLWLCFQLMLGIG